MAKVYDIVNRLKNEKPQVKLAEGHVYTINNSKNSAILMKGISEDKTIDDIDKIDMIIEAGIGKEALAFVNTMNLSISELTLIVNAIMAGISDMELDDMEKAATDEAKKQRKK